MGYCGNSSRLEVLARQHYREGRAGGRCLLGPCKEGEREVTIKSPIKKKKPIKIINDILVQLVNES